MMSETARTEEGSSKNIRGDPPKINIALPEKSEVTQNYKCWKDVQLPIDILLLTVEDCEFISCYYYIVDPFTSYCYELGQVYFGSIGKDHDVKMKVALMICPGGFKAPGSSLTVVKNAVTQLRPKAVFSVGHCSGMNQETTKLGDVVLSEKLTTYSYQRFTKDGTEFCGVTVPVSRDIDNIIRYVGYGWNPPLKYPKERKVEVHCGEVLSGSELVQVEWRRNELVESFPGAIAIETEGEGIYSAARGLKMEWVVVKGISGYADGTETKESWKTFASVTAASLVVDILNKRSIFERWQHYKGDKAKLSMLPKQKKSYDNSTERRHSLLGERVWVEPSWSSAHSFHLQHASSGKTPGAAALVTQYGDAINTSDFVPNVQGAWGLSVQTKCSETKQTCEKQYHELMTLRLSEILPCDNNGMRAYHNSALQETEKLFLGEVIGITTNTVEKQLRQLKMSVRRQLKEWQAKNSEVTKKGCEKLLSELKAKHLDPVIEQLQGRDGSKLAFDDILGVYRRIKNDYDAKAKGAEDAIAAAFADFHPKIAAEIKQYSGILRKLKDFDERAARDKAAEAYVERERRRLEEEQMRLEQENRERENEMVMLITRLGEERAGMLEKMSNEIKLEKEQLQTMGDAGLADAKLKRKAFIEANRALEVRLLQIQKKNEEHMKMMQRFSEMIAKHQREKRELRTTEQLKELPQEEVEESLKELRRRQSEEKNELLRKMDICLDLNISRLKPSYSIETKYNGCDKKLEEVPQMMTSRTQMVNDLRTRIEENEKEQESLVRMVLRGTGPAALYPPSSPYAGEVVDSIAVFAEASSNIDCVVM
ncbi:cingulin-like protein 1 [Stylophora pistillata]|nr:cingulin-like protein 1 [Stylophora pistillata]